MMANAGWSHVPILWRTTLNYMAAAVAAAANLADSESLAHQGQHEEARLALAPPLHSAPLEPPPPERVLTASSLATRHPRQSPPSGATIMRRHNLRDDDGSALSGAWPSHCTISLLMRPRAVRTANVCAVRTANVWCGRVLHAFFAARTCGGS